MKISKIYCNKNQIFEDILFNSQLNIIVAEVRKPENKQKSSHSLGKSLLATLIDFCLLKKSQGKDYFLKKKYNLFEDFIFYLEIYIGQDNYITIKRPVKQKSKISLVLHDKPNQDFRFMQDKQWYFHGGFDKAKGIVTKVFDFDILKERSFRESVSYFLRSPESFNSVFRLPKYMQSSDIQWKPIVAELLGYNSSNMIAKYKKDKELENVETQLSSQIQNEYEISKQEERSKIILSLKIDELSNKEAEYNSFDFTQADTEKPEKLASEIDESLTRLVKENYYLKNRIEQAEKSIFENNDDEFGEIKEYFEEIGIYFGDQLVHDYDDLIQFNKEILSERNDILKELSNDYNEKYEKNKEQISALNKEKQSILSYINATQSFEKFKFLQQEIIELRTQIENIKSKLDDINSGNEIENKKVELDKAIAEYVLELKNDFYSDDNKIIEDIRKHFNYIIKETLGDAGVISTPFNSNNNIEFISEIVDMNTSQVSSKDKGTTYKKLMCCAFDLAVLATYSTSRYFHFVYHDGLFDGLDDRQKANYYKVINEYCDKYNIQYIFTSIQDELPVAIRGRVQIEDLKQKNVIIKILHDEGNEGRLFKMDSF